VPVGRDKGKKKMTLSEIEAQKEREQKERREFRLRQAKDKLFPEDRKRKALTEESESEGGETEDEQEHGKVPCDACHDRKVACVWGGTGRIKACDRCRGFRKSCRVNRVGHRAPSLKKAWITGDSEEETVGPKTPAETKTVPVTESFGRNGSRVGNTGLVSGVVSEAASLQLMAPLIDMAKSLRRVERQNSEFREEILKAQNTELDFLANLCGSLREVSYQLHLGNILREQGRDGDSSDVSESIQQVARVGEDADVGVQPEVAKENEVVESTEVPERSEVVTEKVGSENVGGDCETVGDA
jgi:hypothetical protein